MLKFVKNLSILLLLVFTVYVPNNICGDWYQIPYSTKERVRATVDDGISSTLDFSKELPNLEGLELSAQRTEDFPLGDPQYLAKDDAGLGKNVNLKELTVSGIYPQIPVSLSYLPSVEYFKCLDYSRGGDVVFHNLDYLSRALPSLKTLELCFYSSVEIKRKQFAVLFENISRSELLENLYFNTYIDTWGVAYTYKTIKKDGAFYTNPERGTLTFTDQEIEALSKMLGLKNLRISIRRHMNWDVKIEFDQAKLQLLKNLLPNTNIHIDIYVK